MERPFVLDRNLPLAIYMEGASQGQSGKMGFGILRYSPNPIACVIDSETAGRTAAEVTGIPRDCPVVASVEEAVRCGAKVFVLGIAPSGGLIPAEWWAHIEAAVNAGMSVVNGLHDLVGPRFPTLPAPGQFVWDIRVEPADLKPGTGLARHLPDQRLLLYGTDMAVGKMTTGLEMWSEAKRRGIPTEFVATGQIGITLTGAGVPLDAVRLDFSTGAIEREVLAAAARNDAGSEGLIIVEGQGSLVHPGSTATLPLLRGSCPTHLVLCHREGQTTLSTLTDIKLPTLRDTIKLYEDTAEACGTYARPKTVAVSLNTFHLKDDRLAEEACWEVEDQIGLPCVDPVRHGAKRLVDALR